MAKKVIVGGRIESKEVGGIVTGAAEILDDSKGKKQSVINQETDNELDRLDQSKQDNLTFDNVPTEGSNNPVKSAGVYAADKALSDAIEAILLLIPGAASALNKLVDMATMNSSISTATATFKGTYNVVTDLGLIIDATHDQIAAALGNVISTADNNDYAFVQVPVSAESTDIRRTERYKFNGTAWGYEYDLNTSGFTAAQWAAINSGITLALVAKLSGLPTSSELMALLGQKQDTLTFDNIPTSGSNNPVKSGGVYSAINDEKTAREQLAQSVEGINGRLGNVEEVIPSGAAANNKLVANNSMEAYVASIIQNITASFTIATADGHINLTLTQTNGRVASLTLTSSDIASAQALTALASRVTTAEGNITTLGGRVSTNETDIANLQQLYNDLQQSKPVPVTALPSTGQQQGVIYRLAGTTSYSDYMWNGSTWVLMATYNNAIDEVPTAGSENLIYSKGVFNSILKESIKTQESALLSQKSFDGTKYGHHWNIPVDLNGLDNIVIWFEDESHCVTILADFKVFYKDGSYSLLSSSATAGTKYNVSNPQNVVRFDAWVGESYTTGNVGVIDMMLSSNSSLSKQLNTETNIRKRNDERWLYFFNGKIAIITKNSDTIHIQLPDTGSNKCWFRIMSVISGIVLEKSTTIFEYDIPNYAALVFDTSDNVLKVADNNEQIDKSDAYILMLGNCGGIPFGPLSIYYTETKINSINNIIDNVQNSLLLAGATQTYTWKYYFDGTVHSALYLNIDCNIKAGVSSIFTFSSENNALTRLATLRIVLADNTIVTLEDFVYPNIEYNIPEQEQDIIRVIAYCQESAQTVGVSGTVIGYIYPYTTFFNDIKSINYINIIKDSETLDNTWKLGAEAIQLKHKKNFLMCIQTDTHVDFENTAGYGYAPANANVANNLKLLAAYTGADCIANFGDIIEGYPNDVTSDMRKDMSEIVKRYCYSSTCPVLMTVGNHDGNYLYVYEGGGTPNDLISEDERYARIFAPIYKTSDRFVTNGKSSYYYIDFDNIRVIMLNSQNSNSAWNFVFGVEQINWFVNTAIDTDKHVIVCCHAPLVNDSNLVNPDVPTDAGPVITALENFKNNGGNIVGCLSGHTHNQQMTTINGITYVTFKNYGNLSETIIVDTDNKTIETVGINCNSRSWSY